MKPRELPVGAELQNRYRILSTVKKGGMGMVYLAEDQRFHSRVAVKETYYSNEDFRRAFAREAGLLHRLRHKALPHVTDYFLEGNAQYLVMQYFPGKDLEELLDEKLQETRDPFDLQQVMLWADQLLDALEYLHGHQPPIIHRDIKPQNLKLTEQGDIILLDFGLAKGLAAGMSQIVESKNESVPAFTRDYAPLEQMDGSGTDPRSDLYSMAATIYQLITGQVPADALARAKATFGLRQDPLLPANKLNKKVPESVAAALAWAMAQFPDERPASAKEMRRALREALESPAPDPFSTIRNGIQQPAVDPFATTPAVKESRMGGSQLSTRILSIENNERFAPSTLLRSVNYRIVGVALCLSLLVIAAIAYWRLNRPSGARAEDPSSEVFKTAAKNDATFAPPPLVEVMRCSLEVESDDAKVERAPCDSPVIKGRFLKFHFKPGRSGYLYIT